MSTRILIVEHDLSVGQRMKLALQRVGFVAEWVDSTVTAQRWVGGQPWRPDAVLLDLDLPEGMGEAALPELGLAAPNCRIIALSAYLDGPRMCSLLQANVPSIMKPVEAGEIALVLLRMFSLERGQPAIQDDAPLAPPTPVCLTRREQVIVELLAHGAANKEIASELTCSVKTVEFHVTNLLRKTGASSRLELISRLLGSHPTRQFRTSSPPARECE